MSSLGPACKIPSTTEIHATEMLSGGWLNENELF